MENGFIRHSSSIGRHLMHVSFKTKYCKKIFEYEDVENLCRHIFLKTSEEMKIDIQELGFDKRPCAYGYGHRLALNNRSCKEIKRKVRIQNTKSNALA